MALITVVESDALQPVRLRLRDGTTGGKTLAGFLTPLTLYCSHLAESGELAKWFDGLDSGAEGGLCLLSEVSYSGNWDYDEDEYSEFLLDQPNLDISEEEFREEVRNAKRRWTQIGKVSAVVDLLIGSLERMEPRNLPEDLSWLDLGRLITELEILAAVMLNLVDQGASKMRIRIE